MTAADNQSWAAFVTAFRDPAEALAGPWADLFAPLRGTNGAMVVGQIGQSLDGRIATESGHSHYINGPAGILHLHRLRSLVDAVVIGVGTAVADDPRLTVRHCEGPQPARVVLDPKGRLGAGAKVFGGADTQRILVTVEDTRCAPPAGVEVVALPAPDGRIAPHDVLTALAARGLRRILVEGGAETVSRFLAANCLDRLHVMVAPIILGSGRPGFVLPAIERCDQALRPPMRTFSLDGDTLFDIDLSAQRLPDRANIST
jgi:riboflavin-specific deaminase-like protein